MEQRATIKREFLIERQGKTFALYQGLLDAAHAEGLKQITTDVIQFGTEENQHTWLFRASVTTDRGTFTGFGDASPANVSRAMLNCLPRFAETRAKARALRDAVNVGVAALEELDIDEPEHPAPRPAPRPAPTPQPPTGIAPPPREPTPIQNGTPRQMAADSLSTPAQVRAIYSIARDQHNMSEDDIEDRARTLFGAPPAELTRRQASELISSLQGKKEG